MKNIWQSELAPFRIYKKKILLRQKKVLDFIYQIGETELLRKPSQTQGQKQAWKIKDATRDEQMYNRVLQHEIDHLHGTINIDRVQSKELVFESDPNFYETANFEEI